MIRELVLLLEIACAVFLGNLAAWWVTGRIALELLP